MNLLICVLKIFALFRAVFYLYISVEALLLGFMYWNAYKKFKTTPIIETLERLLLSLGVAYFYMTIAALFSFLDANNNLYDILVAFIPIFTIPVAYYLAKFREKSTAEVPKKGKYHVKNFKFEKKTPIN